ncbi:MAG: hypothetical protein LBU96_14860, partial [Yokenella regensburgei]|nr:hypothetical protein [Yokenella regensburgei]
ARAGVIEAVKAGKVPVVREAKNGLRDLLSIEHDIAPDDLSDSKRSQLRKAMKEICLEFYANDGVPRFKALQKWANSFDQGETLHDFEDWLTAAKDHLGL